MVVRGWQLANACFFAGNVWAVRSIARLDGRNSSALPTNFLTPAPYAFAIWGVIYMMEYLFVCWQLLQGCSLRGQPLPPQRSERLRLLKRISPGWCGANACQIAWCFAFRPSLDTPQLLWISAVCLTGIAGFLSLAHGLLCEESGLSFEELILMYVPLMLHFGWTTAAALVNWNGYVSRCSLDLEWSGWVKVNALWLSVVLAGSLGTLLSLRRKSGLYALTVAWAVLAVASHTSMSEDLREEFPGGEEALQRVAQVEYFLGLGLILVALSVFRRHLKR